MPAGRLLMNPELSRFRLAPGVLALFAAGAGVLVIDATAEEFSAAHANAADEAAFSLRSAINHETYHLLQTVCSGYCFDWAQRIKSITLSHLEKAFWRDFRSDLGWNVLFFLCRAFPDGLRKRLEIERIENVAQTAITHNMLVELAKKTKTSDHSLAGADLPGLFEDLERERQRLHAAGPSALSAFHVIEGSASVAQLILEAPGLDTDDLDVWLARELGRFGDGYSNAYFLAREKWGARASRLFLPAAALALRYERPGEALMPLCGMLAGAASGGECGAARQLAAALPELDGTGRRLGTATDVLTRRGWKYWKKPHSHYEPQLDYLRGSGRAVDEIGALADLGQFDNLPAALLSSVVRLTDQLGGIGVSQTEALLRVNFAGIQLRFMGRARWEKDVQQEMADWAQQVLRRLVDSMPEPQENGASTADTAGKGPLAQAEEAPAARQK